MASVKQIDKAVTLIISDAVKFVDRITILTASEELDTSRNLMKVYFDQDVYNVGKLNLYKEDVCRRYIKLEFLLSEFYYKYKESYTKRVVIKKMYDAVFDIIKQRPKSKEDMLRKIQICSYLSDLEAAYSTIFEINVEIEEDKYNEIKELLSKDIVNV